MKGLLIAFLLVAALSQSVPQITPVNSTLGATTPYTVNYYSFKNLVASTTFFRVDFSGSRIQVPEGIITACSVRYNSVPVEAPSCSCASKVCTFKPNKSGVMNTKVEIEFAGAVNPYYLSNQNLPVRVEFSPLVTAETYNIVIPFSAFSPMRIAINSLNQSDYGVGTYPVTYVINVTLPYISVNPQLQIQIPNDVSFNQVASAVSLNGAVQNIQPMQVLNLLIFNLQNPSIIPTASGFMLITLSGLGNPQFLGRSASFKLTLIETQAVANCANCKIAEVTSGLQIQSKTAGLIKFSSLSSSNTTVGVTTTLSVNCLFYAPVEAGGSVKIYLDPALTVVQPITCENIFGFELSNSNPPTCTFNSTTNVVTTVNFAYPNLVTYGNGIISIRVVNPYDSGPVSIKLETYDNQGRVIGVSEGPFTYSASPKQLSATLSKSNYYVGTPFDLSVDMTLGQTIKTGDYLEIVFPADVPYTPSSTKCFSAGTDLNCQATLNSLSQLVVTMPPPCVVCSSGAPVKFSIRSVMNPSFVNEGNQLVYLNVRTSKGIIEGKEATLNLMPSDVQLMSYNRPTSATVGQAFDLTLQFYPPAYVQANGGQIMIEFTSSAIYVNPLMDPSGMLTGLDYSLEVSQKSSSASLPNLIQYNNDSPMSVMRVTINICDGSISVCPTAAPNNAIELTLKGLKLGYIPSQSTNDTLKITTKLGEVIAAKILDTSSKAPIKYMAALNATFDPSITNYVSDSYLSILSPSVVFDYATITLPTGVSLTGECSLSASHNYANDFSCEKLNPNSLRLNISFDRSNMIGQDIYYFLYLHQINTPTSTRPLTFKVVTYYRDTINQEFSQAVSVESPLKLDVLAQTYSNTTINEVSVVTIETAPKTTSYTGVQVTIPKLTSITSSTWAAEYNFTFTENTTHYILQKSISSANATLPVSFKVKNSLNTQEKATFGLLLRDSSYSVQRVEAGLQKNQPIMLGVQCSSSNRTTGALTSLSCSIDRNNDGYFGEDSLTFSMAADAFDFSKATYNGNQLNATNPTVVIPLTPTSARVQTFQINSLRNIRFVPTASDISGSLQAITQAGANSIGKTLINPLAVVANVASSLPCTATRTNTKSGEYTDLAISCASALSQQSDMIVVRLPEGQNTYLGVSSCAYSDGSACSILAANTTTILISNSRPAQSFILKNLLNYHPNSNLLQVSTTTSPSQQPIEQGATLITPAIELEQVHTEVAATSGELNQINKMTLTLIPASTSISPSDLIVVTYPAGMFSRDLTPADCTVLRADNTTFTGCSFSMNGSWLATVTVKSIGPLSVAVGEKLTITVDVTNGPAPYPFNNQTITVHVKKNDTTYLSEGRAPLAEIYPTQAAFSKISIDSANSTIRQSSLVAGASNSLAVSLFFSGNLRTGTSIIFMVPKDSFALPAATVASREDASYYYLQSNISCPSSTKICTRFTFNSTFAISNGLFLKNQRNSVILYAEYGSLPVSQSYNNLLQPFAPASIPQLVASRSSNDAGAPSTISLSFKNFYPSQTVDQLGVVTVEVGANIINPYSAFTGQYLKEAAGTGDYASFSQNISINSAKGTIAFTIDSQFSSDWLTNQLQITGRNNLVVPKADETFAMKVYNSTHTLYQNLSIKFPVKITPISAGVHIERQENQVTKPTNLSLAVNLPSYPQFPYSSFSISANNVSYGTLTSHQMELDLNSYTNPAIVDNEPGFQVTIANSTHYLFKNDNSQIRPALLAIPLPNVILTLPERMMVSQEASLWLNMSTQYRKDRFILQMPPTMLDALTAVIVYAFDPVNGTLVSQPNVNYTTNRTSETLKVTITLGDGSSRLSLYACKVSFKTPQYQIHLPQAGFHFTYETPTSTFITMRDITIYGNSIDLSISLASYRTNQVCDYTINSKTIQRDGKFAIIIPRQLSQQFVGSDPDSSADDTFASSIQVYVNGAASSVGTTPNSYSQSYNSTSKTFAVELMGSGVQAKAVKLVMQNVVNPPDNRPLNFIVQQSEKASSSQVYGYSEKTLTMTELDIISVSLAKRNTSELLSPITIDMTIQIPPGYEPQTMRILFPSSQVQVLEYSLCELLIDGVASLIPIDPEQDTNDIFLSGNHAGQHVYTLSGCIQNSGFSQRPSETDKVYVSIGSPYQSAETTLNSSVFVTPLITTGMLGLSRIASTSLRRLTYTTLSFQLEPEHYENCDGIVVEFAEGAYWTHSNLLVSINSQNVRYQVISHEELYIQVDGLRAPNMTVQIKNIINYLASGPMTIFTVKKKVEGSSVQALMSPQYNPDDFGVIDLVVTGTLVGQLQPNNPAFRFIAPQPYVSSSYQTMVIMIDSKNPSEYPSENLKISIASTIPGCSRTDLPYSSMVTLKCQFSQEGTQSFDLVIKDSTIAQPVILGQISQSLYIYPELKNVCDNVRCDECSQTPTGGEYCFKCREGMYSNNGKCVQDCPSNQFAYLDQTCESCSPDCTSCFNLDDNSCLGCADSRLFLDSGSCTEMCQTGSPYKNKFCTDGKECKNAPGCRLCSETGFCYQCLPGWDGEPVCSFEDNLPPNLFVFFVLPFFLLLLGLSLYSCKNYGTQGCSGLFYYMMAVIQFFSMVFLIARVGLLPIAMIICAVLLLRVIISIMSYETYYRKLLGGQALLAGEEAKEAAKQSEDNNADEENANNTCKTKLTAFSAHLLCCEAYELLQTRLGQPKGKQIKHNVWYMRLNVVSRILLAVMAVVAISTVKYPNDLLWLSLFALLSSGGILLGRVIQSDAMSRCISQIRGSA